MAQKSGWANNKPGGGRALGIAAHRSFLSYVASIVEVEVTPSGEIRIPRVDIAVDRGSLSTPSVFWRSSKARPCSAPASL